MNYKITLPFLAMLLFSCSANNKLPDTDIGVAQQFITDIEKLNFTDAEKLLLRDEMNNQYFDRFRMHFSAKPKEELEKYQTTSIVINNMENVNDSVTIVNYSNSFNKAEKNKLKMVRSNGKWLVDLKYTFSGNL